MPHVESNHWLLSEPWGSDSCDPLALLAKEFFCVPRNNLPLLVVPPPPSTPLYCPLTAFSTI